MFQTRLTTEQQKEKQKLDEKTRTFTILPSQWEIHLDQEWRQLWIKDAEKWQDKIPETKEFLKKLAWILFLMNKNC